LRVYASHGVDLNLIHRSIIDLDGISAGQQAI
jgi:hypothetical protein